MTDLKDIKKGDRVKVATPNGDVAEFTVTAVSPKSKWLSSEAIVAYLLEGATVEKITPPLPTAFGLYVSEEFGAEYYAEVYSFGKDGWWKNYKPVALEDVEAVAPLRRLVVES